MRDNVMTLGQLSDALQELQAKEALLRVENEKYDAWRPKASDAKYHELVKELEALRDRKFETGMDWGDTGRAYLP